MRAERLALVPWGAAAVALGVLAGASELVARHLPAVILVPAVLCLVLLVPGFAVAAALFPGPADLSAAERMSLSFGLSVAAVPPVALLVQAAGLPVRPLPMGLALALFSTLGLSVAWLRTYRRPGVPADSVAPPPGVPDGARDGVLRRAAGRWTLGVYATSAFAAAFSLVALALAAASPPRQTTEFYLVGPSGTIVGLPTQVRQGERLPFAVGTANREGRDVSYVVRVHLNGAVVATDGPFTLHDGTERVRPYSLAMTGTGGQLVEISLFRDADTTPYRSLSLRLDVLGT